MRKVKGFLSVAVVITAIIFPHYASESLSVGANQRNRTKASKNTARGGKVIDLRDLETLRESFQRDRGKVRLVALLSPT